MKKGTLIHSELSYVIAKLGHKDSLVIGDAGLPIPDQVQRIDLAVTEGIPGFLPVLKAILSEQRIEKVILAEEMKEASPTLHKEVLGVLEDAGKKVNYNIEVEYLPHEVFKETTKLCKAAVRTGEFTPYANVILVSAVVF